MGCLAAAARVIAVVVSTWFALCTLVLLPALLPDRFQYYIYSPASVGLWMVSLLMVPLLACIVLRKWIAGRRPGRQQRS
jgi:hypothetical protein